MRKSNGVWKSVLQSPKTELAQLCVGFALECRPVIFGIKFTLLVFPYFLETPYWKAIAAHTKFRAGYRCQLCNSRMGLVTHHRDYGIHGREHAHIYDLIVLCSYCHQKFHDIEGKKTRSYNSTHKSRLILLGLIVLGVAYFLISREV